MKFKCNIPKAYHDALGKNILRFLVGGSEIARLELGLGESGDGCRVVSMPPKWQVHENHVIGELDAEGTLTASFEYYTSLGALADRQLSMEAGMEEGSDVVDLRFANPGEITLLVEETAAEENEALDEGETEDVDDADQAKDNAGGSENAAKEESDLLRFKLTPHELKVLREHNCDSFADAKKYFEEQGSFEPMKGLSEKSGKALAVKLGLLK